MSHYGAWKMAAWVISAGGATVVALEPSVQIALIVAVPVVIANLGTLILGVLNWSNTKKSLANQGEMKASIDGHFTKLMEKDAQREVEMVDKTDKLSHAEGRREGIESTKDQKK